MSACLIALFIGSEDTSANKMQCANSQTPDRKTKATSTKSQSLPYPIFFLILKKDLCSQEISMYITKPLK